MKLKMDIAIDTFQYCYLILNIFSFAKPNDKIEKIFKG